MYIYTSFIYIHELKVDGQKMVMKSYDPLRPWPDTQGSMRGQQPPEDGTWALFNRFKIVFPRCWKRWFKGDLMVSQ